MLRKTLAVIAILFTYKFGAAQTLGGGTQFSNAVLFNQSWLTGCPASGTLLSNEVAFEPTATIDSCAPLPVCATGTAVSDIWYSFFAQSTTVKIVINPSASFNVAIQAFSGSACPGLTDIGCTDAGGDGVAETLDITGLTINQLYYFRVFGSSNNVSNKTGTGTYTFCGSAQLGGIVLAVEISSFSATKQNNGVQLNWVAAPGSAYFEIERTNNGNNYRSIGKITGAGIASPAMHYSFKDSNPLNINYYRLKMVNNNSSFKYSAVVLIRLDNKLQKAVTILSNPVTDKLNIRVSSDVAANVQLKVINDAGQVVCLQNENVVKGENIIAVTNGMHDLFKGMYTLQVIINNETLNTKFVCAN